MLGLGTQILFVPILGAIALALVVSVIGIPLVVMLPFVVLLTGGLWVSGFTAVAARVGAAIRGSQVGDEPAVADAFAGVVALVALSVVGQLLTLGPSWMGPIGILLHVVGLCVEYVAWTVGMGAAVAALFNKRTRMRPISSTLVTLPS
jgi:hypothetical protein